MKLHVFLVFYETFRSFLNFPQKLPDGVEEPLGDSLSGPKNFRTQNWVFFMHRLAARCCPPGDTNLLVQFLRVLGCFCDARCLGLIYMM